jgi:hypothetical protein
MSSRGGLKRRKTSKAGGRKREAGGGSGGPSSSSADDPSSPNSATAKCEGHAAKLLARVDDLRMSHPHLCDLRIRPGGGGEGTGVAAHSLIMSAASPYVLSKLMRWRDDEHERGGRGGGSLSSAASSSSSSSSSSAVDTIVIDEPITISIPGLDAEALAAAVEFAYTGTVALDPDARDAALPLLGGFQLLSMEDASETVEEWVGDHLDPASALRVQHTAERLHLGRLKKRADAYINQNFAAVTKTEEWQMLPAAAVGEVLSRDELRPGGEIQVFHALVRWATGGEQGGRGGGAGGGCEGEGAGGGGESKEGGQEEEGREAHFVDLLGRCVRASLLRSNDLALVVLREPLVENSLAAFRTMTRALQERAAGPAKSSQLAIREPLCRCRADVPLKIFAVGGEDGDVYNSVRFSSVECFDPLAGQWSTAADMGTARSHGGLAVVNRKMYVVGGQDDDFRNLSSVQCFDPLTGEWAQVADMMSTRSGHGVAAVDGKLYAVGGYDDHFTDLSSMECLNPSTGVWSAVAGMSTARSGVGVAALDDKLYVVGGSVGKNSVSSVDCFDPSTGVWNALANMRTARSYVRVAALDGKLYAVGGRNGPNALRTVECLDPSTGEWSPVAAMSTARFLHGVVVVGSKLYAIGGCSPLTLRSVECFDPVTGVWSAVASMSTARICFDACVMGCPA